VELRAGGFVQKIQLNCLGIGKMRHLLMREPSVTLRTGDFFAGAGAVALKH
jgi:hypothetical protein